MAAGFSLSCHYTKIGIRSWALRAPLITSLSTRESCSGRHFARSAVLGEGRRSGLPGRLIQLPRETLRAEMSEAKSTFRAYQFDKGICAPLRPPSLIARRILWDELAELRAGIFVVAIKRIGFFGTSNSYGKPNWPPPPPPPRYTKINTDHRQDLI